MEVTTPDDLRTVIRRPRPADQSFIAATWVKSLMMADRGLVKSDTNKLVDRLLDDPATRVLVACEPINEDALHGWICYVPAPRLLVVHYVYVRDRVRTRGVARTLVAAARGHASVSAGTASKTVYTMRGPAIGWLARKYPAAISMDIRDFLGEQG